MPLCLIGLSDTSVEHGRASSVLIVCYRQLVVGFLLDPTSIVLAGARVYRAGVRVCEQVDLESPSRIFSLARMA